MSNKEDIEYQHFIDKVGSIIELVQVHLIECPIIKNEPEILQKVLLVQDLLIEIKNETNEVKNQKSNKNES